MKPFRLLFLFTAFLLLSACTNEFCEPTATESPNSHNVSLDVALSELYSVLNDIDNLIYIANFGDKEGYAILGADDRIASVIAITDDGYLTPETFAASFQGEYDNAAEPPVSPDLVNYLARITGGYGDGTLVPNNTRYGPWQTSLKTPIPLL